MEEDEDDELITEDLFHYYELDEISQEKVVEDYVNWCPFNNTGSVAKYMLGFLQWAEETKFYDNGEEF